MHYSSYWPMPSPHMTTGGDRDLNKKVLRISRFRNFRCRDSVFPDSRNPKTRKTKAKVFLSPFIHLSLRSEPGIHSQTRVRVPYFSESVVNALSFSKLLFYADPTIWVPRSRSPRQSTVLIKSVIYLARLGKSTLAFSHRRNLEALDQRLSLIPI
jgi:hypothetical protein